jgi:antitoxin HigA-1
MIPENRIPAHPGEVLMEEFLQPLGITQVELARRLGAPIQRVNEIIQGKRGVTPETAWQLSTAFGTSPEFWLNLQGAYDLARARPSSRTASAFQRLWYLRCLIRGQQYADEPPGADVHAVSGLLVVELGALTASFPATVEGQEQAVTFIEHARALTADRRRVG